MLHVVVGADGVIENVIELQDDGGGGGAVTANGGAGSAGFVIITEYCNQ